MNAFENFVPISIKVYQKSFISGNQDSRIKISYFFNKENGYVYATVHFGEWAQGPPNHVHGGAISAVLDDAMGGVAWMNGHPSMTLRLTVSFHKPLKIGTKVMVETWVEKVSGKKIWLKGKLMSLDKTTLYAKSRGLYFEQTKERFQEMGNIPDEYFKTES